MSFKHYLDRETGVLVEFPCEKGGRVHVPIPHTLVSVPTSRLAYEKVGQRTFYSWEYQFPGFLLNLVKYGSCFKKLPKLFGYCMECFCPVFDMDKVHFYAKNRTIVYETGFRLICDNCLSKFVSCHNCESLYRPEDLEFNVCGSCISSAPKNFIRNYSTKVEHNFDLMGKPKDELYYGIELEFESINYGLDTFLINNEIKEFGLLKKDSSVEQGFEIVSAPCSMDVHYKQWNNLFKIMPKTVKPFRTCGMHVHVSRTRLSSLQLGKILVFLHNAENRHFIRLIAERPSNFQNNYETLKKLADGKSFGQDRHTALNLNNQQTIEFRIFNSTKNINNFLKNIEFCKALIKFTDWATHSIKEAQDHFVFFNFVLKNKKEYPYLSFFLKEKVAPKLNLPIPNFSRINNCRTLDLRQNDRIV